MDLQPHTLFRTTLYPLWKRRGDQSGSQRTSFRTTRYPLWRTCGDQLGSYHITEQKGAYMNYTLRCV